MTEGRRSGKPQTRLSLSRSPPAEYPSFVMLRRLATFRRGLLAQILGGFVGGTGLSFAARATLAALRRKLDGDQTLT